MIKKLALSAAGLALLTSPLAASAQTANSATSPNTSLIAALTQLVQILEQEIQQLIAAQGNPQPIHSCPTYNVAACATGYHTISGGTDANGCSLAPQCIADTSTQPSAQSTIYPFISQVSPQPVSVGAPLTFSLSDGGTEGSINLVTTDGARFWSTGYGTNASEPNGFVTYNGSQLTFTVPSTIGGSGGGDTGYSYMSAIPITSGTYNLYVTSDVSVNHIVTSNLAKSNIVPVQINGNSSGSAPSLTTISPTSGSTNTVITLQGYNLGNATEVDFYHANGQLGWQVPSSATDIAISANSISITISGGAVGISGPDTYQVKVVTPSGTSNAENFTLTAPQSTNPVVINSFSVSPGALTPIVVGQPVTFSWSSNLTAYDTSAPNNGGCWIWGNTSAGQFQIGGGARLSAAGSLSYVPTTVTATYTLNCAAKSGEGSIPSDTRTIQVTGSGLVKG